MFKKVSLALIALTALTLATSAFAKHRRTAYEFDVPVRQNVTAHVVLPVFYNPNAKHHDHGRTLVALPGLGHNGVTFERLAQYIFSTSYGKKFNKVVVIDYPGRGASGLPSPSSALLFGDLTLEDYANVATESLKRLRRHGGEHLAIVAHSMGGMVAQLMQERLLADGSNLHKRFDIDSVLLLAPSIPAPLSWGIADSGAFAQLAGPFGVGDATRGIYLSVPPQYWLGLFFTNLSGNFASGTPDLATATRYVSFEAFAAAAELGGVGVSRATVRQGAFAKSERTKLLLATMDNDPFASHIEHQNLYTHLTTSQNLDGFFTISGADAVHDSYIAAPAILEPALRELLK